MGQRTKERPQKCITCKGEGKKPIEIHDMKSGKTRTEYTPCYDCDGEGWVTEEKSHELAEKKRALAEEILLYWCNCGNPSDDAKYWADGQNPNCSKHCWTCKDCGKLLQVG